MNGKWDILPDVTFQGGDQESTEPIEPSKKEEPEELDFDGDEDEYLDEDEDEDEYLDEDEDDKEYDDGDDDLE